MFNWTKHPRGHFYENEKIFVFFGNKQSSLVDLQNDFSQFEFLKVKQIHSDILVESGSGKSSQVQTADAHYTFEKQKALLVVTADCLPILMYNPGSNVILAVHAGWRGVANRIIPKSIEALSLNGISSERWKIFIGPHIQFTSFEVENPVRDQLVLSSKKQSSHDAPFVQQKTPEKSLINLNQILKNQLSEFSIPAVNINALAIDTVLSLDHHSYRRDKMNSGRNLSFIALK